MKDFRSVISDYLNKHDKHKKQLAAVISLSMLVSFTVPMILQEPASSMTGDSFSPVGDILSTKLFNAQGNMVSNYAGADGNNGYSPAQMSEVILLAGEGSDLAEGATNAAGVIANAKRKYFLGIASEFCVFLENDFIPTAADAEGRVAAGGNVRHIGKWDNYQIGAGDFVTSTALKDTDNYVGISKFAHLIMGGNILQSISLYGTTDEGRKLADADDDLYKRFVVYENSFDYDNSSHKQGNNGNLIKYTNDDHKHNIPWDTEQDAPDELSQLYVSKQSAPLIDFSETFSYIRQQSNKLKDIKMTTGATADYNGSVLNCTVPEGCKDKVIYFVLDNWTDNPTEINFNNIPTYTDDNGQEQLANIIVSCGGEQIYINSQVNTKINGSSITTGNKDINGNDNKNNHKYSENILYNFYAAQNVILNANFNGTILAPNANVTSFDPTKYSSQAELEAAAGREEIGCNGHLSGALIAKSFTGGEEFGYRPYRGTVDILPSSSGYGVPIKKIKPNGDALAGATFGIFKQDSDAPETTFKSDENGNGYVNIPSQVDFSGDTRYDASNNTISNTYVIKEIEAPIGFVKDDTTTWKIQVTETVDIDTIKEINGTNIPTHITTEIKILGSDDNETDNFTIQSFDTYDAEGNNTERRLVVTNGNSTETFIMDIEKGTVKGVGKATSDEPIAINTMVSSKIDYMSTSSHIDTVTTLDENGQPITEVETVIVTAPVDTNKKGTYYDNFQVNWKGNVLQNTERTYTLTLYTVDDNGNISSTTSTKTEGNEYWTPNSSNLCSNQNNIVGFSITANNNDCFSDEKITIEGNKNGSWYTEEIDFTNNTLTWGRTSTESSAETTTATTSVSIVSSWYQTVQTIIYEDVPATKFTDVESIIYKYDTETIPGLATKSNNYQNSTTFTTVVSDTETEGKDKYQFDPTNKMIMPLPSEAPTFENDYGLMFSKWGVSNDVFVEFLPNAEIDVMTADGNTTVLSDILNGTNGSITINLSELDKTGNTVYQFVEKNAPNGYEKADPIFFTIDGTTVKYGNDDKCTGGTFDLTANGTDNAQSVVMKDTKISGAEIKLSKWNADLTEQLSGAEFQLYADTGEGVLIYPLGDNETFTITDTDFNLYKTLKNADDSKYNTEYIKDGYLKEGRYYLKEVNAPTGYTAQDKFKFKVNSDYSIEMVESGVPAYISFTPSGGDGYTVEFEGGDGEQGKKQIRFKNFNVANVTKIEVVLNEGFNANTQINVYECDSVNGNKTIDSNGIATWDNLNNVSFNQIKFQNNSYDKGLNIKEVRIYGEVGEGSGGSSGGSSNYPEGVLVSDDKNTITIKDNALSKAKNKPDEKFITIEFNSTGAGGQIKYNGGQYVGNNLGNDGLPGTISYSLNEVYNILKNSGASLNSINDINDLIFALWNGGGVKNITFSLETAEPEITTTPDTPAGDDTETTPAALNVTVEGDMIKIPNSKQGDKTTISVEKKWADSVEKFPELKPASIQVKLNRYLEDGTTLANPETSSEVKTLDEAHKWKASWTDLDSKYTDNDGNEKFYKYMVVEETNLQDYKAPTYLPSEPTANGTIEITNTPETIEITAEKIWIDGEDNQIIDNSLLPTEIQVKLQYKGENTDWTDVTDGTYTLTSADGWKKTISDLPAVYEYKIVELNVPNGWEVHETADTAKKGDLNASITNKQQVGSLEINKEWKGDTASDRPNSINIELYRSTQSPVSGSSAIENKPETSQYDNYAKALQYSLYFYDANMCGSEVTENSAVKWRNDCHTYNTADGGFHDAGDHVMFGLPQGYTASTLGWSYYEFKDAYDSLGQTEHYKKIMDEFARFIKNSTTLDANGNVSTLIWQKGDNNTDHNYWGSPEEQGNYGNELLATSGVSDIAAEYAATLALNYLNFGNEEDLKYAEALYNFSTINSSGSGNNYANASYEDDQAWAESWLYLATNNNKYKENYEKRNLSITSPINDANAIQVHNWYNVTMGAKIAYAHISDDWNEITSWLDNQVKDNNYKNYNSWGSARHNATAQLCALAVAKNISDTDATKAKTYTDWAKSQMNYLLGDNDGNICLLTGYAENSVKHPHHRAASVNQNDANYKHTLVGALVGGPQGTSFANYPDTVNNYTENEVALDYNAGFVGAAAGLYYFYHTGTLADDNTLNALEIDTTKYDETPVNVKNYETIEISDNKNIGILNIGDEKKLVLENHDGKTITWSSDSQSVATITEKGILTAVEDGTATIKATVNGTVVAEYTVTVQIASINTGYISADNGYQLVKSITINADNNNNWNIIEPNLPLYDANGRKYYYYIKEKDVQKYYAISYTNGVSLDNDTNSVSVTNKKYDNGGVTMPSSGGTGTRNYYVVGACIIGIAGIFLIRRRKKVTE